MSVDLISMRRSVQPDVGGPVVEKPMSPKATGGAGTIFEYQVGAILLAKLLREAVSPVGPQEPVVSVAFQQRNRGILLDDIVVFMGPDDNSPQVQFQVKKNVNPVPSNKEFVEVVTAMLGVLRAHSERVKDGTLVMGLVSAGPTAQLEELADLTDTARQHTHPDELAMQFEAGVANQTRRDRYAMVKETVAKAVGAGPDSAEARSLTAQVLAGMRVWPVPEGTDSLIWRTELDAVAELAADTGKSAADIMGHLRSIAEEIGPNAGRVDRQRLWKTLGVWGVRPGGSARPGGGYRIEAAAGATVFSDGVHHHYYNGDERVETVILSARDFEACADERFVEPGGDWADASGKLDDGPGLIMIASPGNGRRTAALRLLSKRVGQEQVRELRPMWSSPKAKLLPSAETSIGYLIDISDPTDDSVSENLARDILTWAAIAEAVVVITTTDDDWVTRWTKDCRDLIVRLSSPDAKLLVASELTAAGATSRLGELDSKGLAHIWRSSPKAEDAMTLAALLKENLSRPLDEVIDEYEGWQSWIEDKLPSDLGDRTLLWSGAFCNGGSRKSILSMSEDLRAALGRGRNAADILADTPPSKRLRAALMERKGNAMVLAESKRGLAGALCRHLWAEFEGQREIIRAWAVTQVGILPADDARLVADSLLDVAAYHGDVALLDDMRKALSSDAKRPIAVGLIERAVLDARFGPKARQRIYDWVQGTSPDSRTLDLVAAVCGGRFGIEFPDRALVRLGWVARKSAPGSQALQSALHNMVNNYPDAVLKSLKRWFTNFDSSGAGVNAFIALAASDQGTVELCRRADLVHGSPEFRTDLVGYFRVSLEDPESRAAMLPVIDRWAGLAMAGAIDLETALEIFLFVLIPEATGDVLRYFLMQDDGSPGGFWDLLLRKAVQEREAG